MTLFIPGKQKSNFMTIFTTFADYRKFWKFKNSKFDQQMANMKIKTFDIFRVYNLSNGLVDISGNTRQLVDVAQMLMRPDVCQRDTLSTRAHLD